MMRWWWPVCVVGMAAASLAGSFAPQMAQAQEALDLTDGRPTRALVTGMWNGAESTGGKWIATDLVRPGEQVTVRVNGSGAEFRVSLFDVALSAQREIVFLSQSLAEAIGLARNQPVELEIAVERPREQIAIIDEDLSRNIASKVNLSALWENEGGERSRGLADGLPAEQVESALRDMDGEGGDEDVWPKKGYFVTIGQFETMGRAQWVERRMKREGVRAVGIRMVGDTPHVVAGPWTDIKMAEAVVREARVHGFENPIIFDEQTEPEDYETEYTLVYSSP